MPQSAAKNCHEIVFDIFDLIEMFSSEERLAQRTPQNGIDRKEYINLLVDEYYESTNIGKYFSHFELISRVNDIYRNLFVFNRGSGTGYSKFSKFFIRPIELRVFKGIQSGRTIFRTTSKPQFQFSFACNCRLMQFMFR